MGAGRRPVTVGALHHVEVWVPDLSAAMRGWGWLLDQLGWTPFQEWPAGRSWRLGPTYLVLEESPALSGRRHDRLAPGLNHLAFHCGPPAAVDRLVAQASGYGWELLFPDRHPHAGGPDTYAAYLVDGQGYEVELVAS
ncbi:Catechol 2,3-dioxygenase [Micromonospora phaseoli]|uniref:Catechol 2,3-dioxygenase n=1 Tax=Micromonospora phaseoli TaxID=1144548 RepID=A0A1H6WD78_9ACTN|nr:VOC family protein [Micromonospora phaseoli]PZW01757.1 catechol 2,3-dioxygenase-like lactoylglutathione lyase family enzyme [Micromonospora phaseoli]SEJ14823.1 Catechol 2,3-dioxygenase [Micromonospora phaseoli]